MDVEFSWLNSYISIFYKASKLGQTNPFHQWVCLCRVTSLYV